MPPAASVRSRLNPEVRKQQIVEAAAKIIVEQGLLPIPFEALSQRVGISKALVYSYFPTQYDLVNAVLERELDALTADGLDEASQLADPKALTAECASRYFRQVAANGRLLHIILSDRYMAGRLEPRLTRRYGRIMLRLGRRLRDDVGLSPRDSLAALNMLVALVEEIGDFVHLKRLDGALGQSLCLEMVSGGLEGLRAAGPAPSR